MSLLYILMHPYETNPPIDSGRLVPWMAYSPPRRVSAACPTGLFGAPPGIDYRESRGVSPNRLRCRPSRPKVFTLDSRRAAPCHTGAANANRKSKRVRSVDSKVKLALAGFHYNRAGIKARKLNNIACIRRRKACNKEHRRCQ